MRWPDGPFLFSYGLKSVNTSLFGALLLKLEARARRTGKRIVLVIDNGSAHKSKLSSAEIERVRDVLRVFWLPTYTSEQLNDIEGLWKHLKEDYFCRMLVTKHEQFVMAVVAFLATLARHGVLRKIMKPRHRSVIGKNFVEAA